MGYSYDRNAKVAPGDTTAAREHLKDVVTTLEKMGDYFYEGATPAAMSKALGLLATGERLLSGLRVRIERMR